MIQYVFEDSDSSTLSIFFKSLYSSEELSRIHFVGSNKNLFKKASDIVEHCTDDYIVVYLDMVPGIPIEVSIYNRLRSLSLRNDARIAVMPITCFEYFTIKSLRLVGVHEKYKQSIDLNNTKKYTAFYLRGNRFLMYTSTMGQLNMYKSMLYVERNTKWMLKELEKWEDKCSL